MSHTSYPKTLELDSFKRIISGPVGEKAKAAWEVAGYAAAQLLGDPDSTARGAKPLTIPPGSIVTMADDEAEAVIRSVAVVKDRGIFDSLVFKRLLSWALGKLESLLG